jgi:hypothetical protein
MKREKRTDPTVIRDQKGRMPNTPVVRRRTRVELSARILDAIFRTQGYEVVYKDVVGEGAGAWHSLPRYPADQLNCLVWLQLILAEAYGNDPVERLAAMDRLRYYFGCPAFSLRKHYIDHWLALDPGPLRPLSLQEWVVPREHQNVLDPSAFLAHLEFPFPLYQMERRVFEFDYYDAVGIAAAARELPDGCYVMFAVPTDVYLNLYGTYSGPMGLVHGFMLHLATDSCISLQYRRDDQCTVYHASTSASRVISQPLVEHLAANVAVHRGYVLCELDPEWNPSQRLPWDPEARSLWEHELQLARRGFRRSADRDFRSAHRHAR